MVIGMARAEFLRAPNHPQLSVCVPDHAESVNHVTM